MSDQSTKNAGICPAHKAEVIKMNAAFEARELVASIAGPAAIGGKIKEALYRVARITGLPQRRVRGIWNNEARAIRAEEIDALRRVAGAKKNEATNEVQALAARLSALEERLTKIDPDYHRPDIDALRRLGGRVGCLDPGGWE